MKKTVEDYLEAITHISLRAVGASRSETLINGDEEMHEKPEKLWFILSWAAQGIGFGEASFYTTQDGHARGLVCDDESMGATFIEALLVKLARSTKMTGK